MQILDLKQKNQENYLADGAAGAVKGRIGGDFMQLLKEVDFTDALKKDTPLSYGDTKTCRKTPVDKKQVSENRPHTEPKKYVKKGTDSEKKFISASSDNIEDNEEKAVIVLRKDSEEEKESIRGIKAPLIEIEKTPLVYGLQVAANVEMIPQIHEEIGQGEFFAQLTTTDVPVSEEGFFEKLDMSDEMPVLTGMSISSKEDFADGLSVPTEDPIKQTDVKQTESPIDQQKIEGSFEGLLDRMIQATSSRVGQKVPLEKNVDGEGKDSFEEVKIPTIQEEILAEAVGKNNRNPIKVTVDVAEKHTAQAMSSETVANVIKIVMKTESKKDVSETVLSRQNHGINFTADAVKMDESGDNAQMARNSAGGETLENFVIAGQQQGRTAREAKVDFPSLLGMVSETVTEDKNSSKGSEFLYLDKTYGSDSVAKGGKITPANRGIASRTVIEQIKVEIKRADTADKINIKLKPRELGNIEIKIAVSKDGAISANIQADKKETLELLQKDVRGLEKALQEAGLKTDGSNSFNFSLKGEGDQRSDGQPQQQARSGNNRNSTKVANDETECQDAASEYVRAGISIKV